MNQGRFNILRQLGQGSFSTIHSAIDKVRGEKVALKVEKPDKSKKVLHFEYQVLKNLQGLPNICKIYDFIESDKSDNPNFIVMQMLGKNLANLKKSAGKSFTPVTAIKLLIQMLDSIERLHKKGYIHRDIKPSNFVVGKGKGKNLVFMVDFGLAKLHLNKNGTPLEQRKNADFRGTITYASLNAHNKIDLSRRDDLWSFYFVILDFMNEQLPWRNYSMKDEVKNLKTKCLKDPENLLWKTTVKENRQVKDIFYHLNSLKYEDEPDYNYIRIKLNEMLEIEINKERSTLGIDTISTGIDSRNNNSPAVASHGHLKRSTRKRKAKDDDFHGQQAEVEHLAMDHIVKIDSQGMFPSHPHDNPFTFNPAGKAEMLFQAPSPAGPANASNFFYSQPMVNSGMYQQQKNTPPPPSYSFFGGPPGMATTLPPPMQGATQMHQGIAPHQQPFASLFQGLGGVENEDFAEYPRKRPRGDSFNNNNPAENQIYEPDYMLFNDMDNFTRPLNSKQAPDEQIMKFRPFSTTGLFKDDKFGEQQSEEIIESYSTENFPFSNLSYLQGPLMGQQQQQLAQQNQSKDQTPTQYQGRMYAPPQSELPNIFSQNLMQQQHQNEMYQKNIPAGNMKEAPQGNYYPAGAPMFGYGSVIFSGAPSRMNTGNNDVIQLFASNFININQLNQLNNALIINNNSALSTNNASASVGAGNQNIKETVEGEAGPIMQMSMNPHQVPLENQEYDMETSFLIGNRLPNNILAKLETGKREEMFRIEVDHDYYCRLYADERK